MITNPDIHAHMIALGYNHTHHDCEAGDNGGCESGPMPWFEPAYDEYWTHDDLLIFDENGNFLHYELCPDIDDNFPF